MVKTGVVKDLKARRGRPGPILMRSPVAAAVVLAALGGAAGSAVAQQPPPAEQVAPDPGAGGSATGILVAPPESYDTGDLLRRDDAVPDLRPLAFEDLISRALDRNFDLALSRHDMQRAEARQRGADAAYDPILSMGLNYSQTMTWSRTARINRLRDGDPSTIFSDEDPTAVEPEQEAQEDDIRIGCIFVDNVLVPLNDPFSGCDLAPNRSTELEYASFGSSSIVNPYSWTGNLGVGQTFGFGATVSANLTTLRRTKNGYSNPLSPLGFTEFASGGPGDPFGWGDPYRWSSTLTVGFTTPLPFTKGFGEIGSPANLEIKQAEADYRRAVATAAAQRNLVLAQVLEAYLGLVQKREEMVAITRNLDLITQINARVQRQFDLGRVTTYEASQVAAEEANVRNQQEIARNDYLQLSNQLRVLLADGDQVVYEPVATALMLDRFTGQKPAQGTDHDALLAGHPRLKVAEERLAAARAATQFRENQALPDISFTVSYTMGQSDTVYGYEDMASSWGHMFNPDKSDLFVGLRYNVSLSDVEEAAFARARLTEVQASHALAAERNAILKDVESALKDVRSAEAQVGRTGDDVALATDAFDRAQRLSAEGLLPYAQMLDQYADLLTAQLQNINAKVGLQRAVVRYLAAIGALDGVVAEQKS